MNHQLAVIFDMDGVLVDSYHAHLKSWQALAAGEGRTISEAEFAAQFGRTNREIIVTYWAAEITPITAGTPVIHQTHFSDEILESR